MKVLEMIFGKGKEKEKPYDKPKDMKAEEKTKSDRPKPADNRDFLGLRGAQKKREQDAGLKCGGMVKKKYAKGGVVRGAGCAVKGKKFTRSA